MMWVLLGAANQYRFRSSIKVFRFQIPPMLLFRSDNARLILRDLGARPGADHADESIFNNFYNSVQETKELVGQEIDEVRAEIRDTFALLGRKIVFLRVVL